MIRVVGLPQRLPQLHLAGRVWIWSLRYWVFADRNGTHVPRCVWRTLEQAWQSNPARHEMTALWSDLHAGARKPIVVRAPSDTQMSLDERMLAGALSAARVQLPDVVRWFLADLFRAGALDDVCRRFAQLGARIRVLADAEDHHAIDICGIDPGDTEMANVHPMLRSTK